MAVRMVRGSDGKLRRWKPVPEEERSEEPVISEQGIDMGLLNVKQAADALGVSERTLRNWCSARKIPFIKVGARVMFDKEDLKTWLKEKRVEASGK